MKYKLKWVYKKVIHGEKEASYDVGNITQLTVQCIQHNRIKITLHCLFIDDGS